MLCAHNLLHERDRGSRLFLVHCLRYSYYCRVDICGESIDSCSAASVLQLLLFDRMAHDLLLIMVTLTLFTAILLGFIDETTLFADVAVDSVC